MMLRYTASAFLLIGATAVVAQPTLTVATSVPVPPLDVPLITSTTNYLDPGPAGANVDYHYWNMLTVPTGNKIIYYRDASVTSTSAAIPAAELISTDGGNDTSFWAVTTNGLEQVGVRTDLEGTISFTDASLELKLPCTFGTTWSDALGANYIVSGIISVTRIGTITGIGDGYGTLSMPGNVTLPTVLRVKVRRDVSDNSAVANVHRIANIHYYYIPTLPHPYVTLTQDSVQIGTGAWTVAKSATWQGNPFLVGMEDINPDDFTFNAYPNPVSEMLSVTFAQGATTNVRIELIDATGRMVSRQSVSGGTGTIDTKGFAAGVYSLRVSAGEQLLGTRRITVQ